MSDGRIVFDTAIDNSGAEKDISELRKDISDVIKNVEDSTVKSSKQLQQTISSACDKITAEAKELPSVMKEAAAESEKAFVKSNNTAKKTIAELANESGKTATEIRADIRKIAEAYQQAGDSIPTSYKKAYNDLGVMSDAAARKQAKAAKEVADHTEDTGEKIRKESERTKDSVTDDAEGMGNAHRDQAKKAESKWSAAFSKIKKGMQTCAKVGRTALKAVGVAAAAVVTVATLGVNYNNQMEAYNTSFKTMLGSAEAAYTMVADLKELAAETPLEMSTLASDAQTMLSFGISDKKTLTYLKQLGDVSQGDADKFSSLTLAFSQIQSAGKLTGQDLLQLINAGFNPLQILSEKTGKSMAALKKEMSEGKISAKMVAKAFEIATSEGGIFFKAMEAQSKTFSGRMSTLKDNALSFLGELTEGIQNELKDTLLPTVTDYLDQLQSAYTSGGIKALSKATGDVLSSAITEIASYTPLLIDTAVSVVTSFVQSLDRNSEKVAAAAVKIVKSLVNGLVKLIPEVERAASKILSAFVNEIFGPKAGNAVKKLTDSVRKSLDLIFKTVKKVVVWLKPVVKNILSTIANMTKSTIPALTATLKILEPALWLVCKAFQGISWVIEKTSECVDSAIGWFGKLIGLSDDTSSEYKQLSESIEQNVTAWQDLRDISEQNVQAFAAEEAETDYLIGALDRLVDENGKVIGSKDELKSVISKLKEQGYDVEYDAISDQIKNYKTLREEIQKTYDQKKYASRIDSLEPLYSTAKENEPAAFDNWAKALKALNDEKQRLKDEPWATDINISGLQSDVDKAFAIWQGYVDTINTYETATQLYDTGSTEKAIDLLDDYYYAYVDVTSAAAQYSSTVNSDFETLKNTFQIQLEGFKSIIATGDAGLISSAQTALEVNAQKLREAGANIPTDIVEGIKSGKYQIDEIMSQIGSDAAAGFTLSADAGKDDAYNAGKTLSLELINGSDSVMDYGSPSKTMYQYGTWTVEGYALGIDDNIPLVEDAAANIADSCIDELNNVKANSYEIGQNSITSLIAGVNSKRSGLISTAAGIANAFVTKMKKALKINSPSRVTREIGLYTGEGMNIGLKQSLKAAASTAYSQAANLVDKMRSAVNSRRAALAESIVGNTTNNTNTTNNYDERSFNQSFNFYSPNPTPSQTARAARLAMEVT